LTVEQSSRTMLSISCVRWEVESMGMVLVGVPFDVEAPSSYESPYGRVTTQSVKLSHKLVPAKDWHERIEVSVGELSEKVEAAAKAGTALQVVVSAWGKPGKNGGKPWVSLVASQVVPTS